MPAMLMSLILVIWLGAIAALIRMDIEEKFLSIPVVLALAGIFCSMLPLAVSPTMSLFANAIVLTLFVVSLEVLKPIPMTVHRVKT